MMICPICKSNIRDDAVFCPVCGKPVPQNNPNIHNIETVELPKNNHNSEQDLSSTQVAENTEVIKESFTDLPDHEPVEPVPSGYPSGYQKQASHQDSREHPVQESLRSVPVSHENPTPRQPGRPSPHHREVPRQRTAQNEQDPRPNARRNGSMRPVSEKEAFRIRDNISKKVLIAFICSIFGLCTFALNLPCAIVGLVFSIIVRNEYRNRGWKKDTDLKLANAAFICSIIGIVIGVIGIIILMVSGAGIVAALASLASMPSGGGYYGF